MSEEIRQLKLLLDTVQENYFTALRTDISKKQRLLCEKVLAASQSELHGALGVLGLIGLTFVDHCVIVKKKRVSKHAKRR